MTKPDLKTLTNQQLDEKIKMFKMLTGVILGMQIVGLGAGIFANIQGMSILTLTPPFIFIPALVILITNTKKYQTELESRHKK